MVKQILYDGITGEPYKEKVAVGIYVYDEIDSYE